MIAGGLGTLARGWTRHRVPRRWIAVTGYSAVTSLRLALLHAGSVGAAISLMMAISFCCDFVVQTSWNSCVELGRR